VSTHHVPKKVEGSTPRLNWLAVISPKNNWIVVFFFKFYFIFLYYLKAVLRPRNKHQEARLRVEGEPLDVDFAIRFENDRGFLRRKKSGRIKAIQIWSPIRELSRKFLFCTIWRGRRSEGWLWSLHESSSHGVLPIGAIFNMKRKKNKNDGFNGMALTTPKHVIFQWLVCVSSVES
jgi:hypothetical protein